MLFCKMQLLRVGEQFMVILRFPCDGGNFWETCSEMGKGKAVFGMVTARLSFIILLGELDEVRGLFFSSKEMKRKHFFKVLLGDFSNYLRIPPAFVKNISKDASQKVMLEGPSGRVWQVELIKRNNGMYLENGWCEFVKDHCLQAYDFLLFGYGGDMHFTVQIFDQTACERKDAMSVKTSPKATFWEGKKKQGPWTPPPEPCGLVKIKKGNVDRSLSRIDSRTMKSEHLFPRQLPKVEETERPWEKANSFTSNFPFFITQLKIFNVVRTFVLHIPNYFSGEHLPREKTKIFMRGPSGVLWGVNYVYDRKRAYLSGGWTAFSRCNNLRAGDVCVFELVSERKMQMHVFRLVDE